MTRSRALTLLLSAVLLLAVTATLTAAATSLTVSNPFLVGTPGNVAADPDVVRINQADGSILYILTHTQKNSGGSDFPLYTSSDLVHWTLAAQALNLTLDPNPEASVQIGAFHYCGCWAPEIRPAGAGAGYVLSFTASRFATAQNPCQGYDEGSGVYMATSPTPLGPYVNPVPMGASLDPAVCPPSMHDAVPFSHQLDFPNCGPPSLPCNNSMRLDSDLFNDPLTGESFFAYAWYTDSNPTRLPFESSNLGEHVNIVAVDAQQPWLVPCDVAQATKVWALSPHDNATITAMANACDRCGEQLSFVRGRHGEIMEREGVVWGVAEAPMMFRRGGMIYLLAAHSAWDSAFYAVAWIAAPTVPELDLAAGSPNRLVGRLLIPSLDQSFGHGSAVLGPDDEHWFFIHHHLNHTTCNLPSDLCARDIYLSPLVFEDRGDGRGDVWIREWFAAEDGMTVEVFQRESVEPRDGGIGEGAKVALGLAAAVLGLAAVAFCVVRQRAKTRDADRYTLQA